jgi:hypothetical protein
MAQPDDDTGADDQRLVVVVVRSGGVAGLRRQWRAEPPARQEAHWAALVDDCPWDDPPLAATGADRYVWRITVTTAGGSTAREAEVPDSGLAGPWRALVDEVRTAGAR